MNLQQYASKYSHFHGVMESDLIENCIVYNITKVSWSRSIVLKLKNFSKAYDQPEQIKPLAKGLMKHFKLETLCTIFKTDDSFSLLYGNISLAFPKSDGEVSVVATNFFVGDNKIFQKHMEHLKAECVHENIYYYKSSVIYLDEFDIPYPGGEYFHPDNNKNDVSRICFLLDRQERFRLHEFVDLFRDASNIHSVPLKTKFVQTDLSKFIDFTPVSETLIPTNNFDYTNIIVKKWCFQHPNFIVQDILNSYHLTELGLVLEYPIYLSYVANHKANFPRRYYCLAINCHQPKQFLHVPAPFDRFYKYNYNIKDIEWVTLYYDRELTVNVLGVTDVVLNTQTIGYVYRNTFFCLSHPKLSAVPNVPNRNTRYLLNTLTFDLEEDKDVNLIYMHRFDADYVIYCVKHKNLPYDMWCLQQSKHYVTNYRTDSLPYLVREWAQLVLHHSSLDLNFGDLNFIRLMFLLAKHKICFNVREGEDREILYEKEQDIIFQVEKSAIEFINETRLDIMKLRDSVSDSSVCRLH